MTGEKLSHHLVPGHARNDPTEREKLRYVRQNQFLFHKNLGLNQVGRNDLLDIERFSSGDLEGSQDFQAVV